LPYTLPIKNSFLLKTNFFKFLGSYQKGAVTEY
jgi:hypothetical protein